MFVRVVLKVSLKGGGGGGVEADGIGKIKWIYL